MYGWSPKRIGRSAEYTPVKNGEANGPVVGNWPVGPDGVDWNGTLDARMNSGARITVTAPTRSAAPTRASTLTPRPAQSAPSLSDVGRAELSVIRSSGASHVTR